MKTLAILFIGLFLIGCVTTPAPTLEQLEIQAMLTGDWSAVEKREQALKRRLARQPLQCESGYVTYCELDFVEKRCSCVHRDLLFH